MGVRLLRVESWAGCVLDVRLPLGVVLVTAENAERGMEGGRVRRNGYRRAFLTGLFVEGGQRGTRVQVRRSFSFTPSFSVLTFSHRIPLICCRSDQDEDANSF